MDSLLTPDDTESVDSTTTEPTRSPIRQVVYEVFMEEGREDDYYKAISDPKKLKLLAEKYGDPDSIKALQEIGEFQDVGEHLPKDVFGVPISKDTAGTMVSWQRGITGATRGILQLAGSDEMQAELKAEDEVYSKLRESQYYSAGAEITGAVMEPIGWTVPMGNTAKAVTVYNAMKTAGVVGAPAKAAAKRELYKAIGVSGAASGTYGAMYYVEEDESRLDNALLFGGVGLAASSAGAYFRNRGISRQADEDLAIVEQWHVDKTRIMDDVSEEQKAELISKLSDPKRYENASVKAMELVDVERHINNFIEARKASILAGSRLDSPKVDDVVDEIIGFHKKALEEKRNMAFTLGLGTKTKGGKAKPKARGNTKLTPAQAESVKKTVDNYMIAGLPKYVEKGVEGVVEETASPLLAGVTRINGKIKKTTSPQPKALSEEQAAKVKKVVDDYLFSGLPKYVDESTKAAEAVDDKVVEAIFPELVLESGEKVVAATKKGVYETEKSARAALNSNFTTKLGITPETHKVVAVEGGYGVVAKETGEAARPSIIPKKNQEGFVSPELMVRGALAGVGTAVGFATEEGGSIVGGIAGAAAGFIAPSVFRRMWKSASNRTSVKVQLANKVLDEFEYRWAENVRNGLGADETLKATIRSFSPGITDKIAFSKHVTSRPLRLARTEGEAISIIESMEGIGKPSVYKETIQGVDATLAAYVPRVYGRIMEHFQSSREEVTKNLSMFDEFASYLRSNTSVQQYKEFSDVWLDGHTAVVNWLKDTVGDAGVAVYMNKVKPIVEDIGQQMVDAKIISELQEDYLPRFVTDYQGLVKHFPIKEGELALPEVFNKFEKKMGRPPSDIEKSYLVQEMLEGRKVNLDTITSSGRDRVLTKVPKQLRQYYSDPVRTMHTFIQRNLEQVSKSRLFGEKAYNFIETADGKVIKQKVLVSLDNAIESLIVQHHPDLTKREMYEVKNALTALFGKGEVPPWRFLQVIRDMSTGVVLGNPLAAATQIGDMLTPSYLNGVKNNIKGIIKAAGVDKNISAKDWGFVNHWSEEYVSTIGTKQFANFMLKTGGFRFVDLLGKDVFLNSTYSAYKELAQGGEAGVQALRERIGKYFPEEALDSMVDVLNRGGINQDIKTAIFIDLAKLQPITPAQFSRQYLENPNLRFLYYLKSFMLRWVNRVKMDSIDEIQKGNVKTGLQNLTYITMVLGASGLVSNQTKRAMLYGPGVVTGDVEPNQVAITEDLESLPVEVFANAVKTLGMSEYLADQVASGNVLKGLGSLVSTPMGIFDNLFSLGSAVFAGEEGITPDERDRIMNVGWLKLYNTYFGSGFERMLAREEKLKERGERKWERRLEGIEEAVGYAEGGLVTSNIPSLLERTNNS